MRYDPDERAFIVDDDCSFPVKFFITESYDYPGEFVLERHDGHKLTQETRVVRGYFENRWGVSIIWGSMTYSDNKEHPWGMDYRTCERLYPPFVEEPFQVEVGIIMPEPLVVPERPIGPRPPGWTGPEVWPEHTIELWGDPLGWVDSGGLRVVLDSVSRFDSHDYRQEIEGPYLMEIEGRLRLVADEPVLDEERNQP